MNKELVISAGTQTPEPLLFDATFPHEKLHITLERGATVSIHESVLDELTIIAHEHAMATVHVVITDSQEKKITLQLMGDYARINLICSYALNGLDHARIDARQEHHAAHTKSSILLHGVLSGQAHVEHKGMIFVAHQALHSEVSHHNKTILLSRASWIDSSPDLEVLQQNVQCSHGTAVGPLDEAQLLYLRSRGLAEHDAQRLLLKAFFNLPDDGYVKKGELQGLTKKLQEIL